MVSRAATSRWASFSRVTPELVNGFAGGRPARSLIEPGWLSGPQAAVDQDGVAGDELRQSRNGKQDHPCHIVGDADPS